MAFEHTPSTRYAGRPKPAIPLATRRAVEKRAQNRCEKCGDRPIELHHLHYDTEGHETADDLAAYCRGCHRAAHTDEAGDFWVDPQEMQNFWALYDKYNWDS